MIKKKKIFISIYGVGGVKNFKNPKMPHSTSSCCHLGIDKHTVMRKHRPGALMGRSCARHSFTPRALRNHRDASTPLLRGGGSGALAPVPGLPLPNYGKETPTEKPLGQGPHVRAPVISLLTSENKPQGSKHLDLFLGCPCREKCLF